MGVLPSIHFACSRWDAVYHSSVVRVLMTERNPVIVSALMP